MRLVPVVLAAAAAATGLAACGSSDDGSAGKAASTPAPPAATTPAAAAATPTGGALTVTATEYAFAPATIDAKAGKLKITMKNAGKYEHELVLLKTDAAPDALKVTGARVSEADSVGEISETKGGAEASKTFDLKPGSYVYVCNIPGHYGDGMHGKITVG